MSSPLLRWIRETAHPLHVLRRNRFLSEHVLPGLDVTLARRLNGVEWPVYLRLVRNFSYVVNSGLVEPGQTALMTTVIKRTSPQVFWDVGANIGFYSWLFLSQNPSGQALLLEPEPENVMLLQRTIERARLKGATCLAIAASDQIGRMAFARDLVSGATGGFVGDEDPFIARHYGLEAPVTTVATTTLDELACHQPPPDLVKIDVEGAERWVLGGAQNVLADFGPIVFFESSQHRPEVMHLFRQHGYDVFPSSSPTADPSDSSDFIAVPEAMRASWPEIRETWTARLKRPDRRRFNQR